MVDFESFNFKSMLIRKFQKNNVLFLTESKAVVFSDLNILRKAVAFWIGASYATLHKLTLRK